MFDSYQYLVVVQKFCIPTVDEVAIVLLIQSCGFELVTNAELAQYLSKPFKKIQNYTRIKEDNTHAAYKAACYTSRGGSKRGDNHDPNCYSYSTES